MLYPAELCGHFIGEGSRLVKSIPNDSVVSIFALIAALKQAKKKWRAREDSNLQPPESESVTLSIELRAHT